MVDGSPAWKPHATLALVTMPRRASSSPSRHTPKPSPRSLLRSTESHRIARAPLRERREVARVDDADHRVAAGGRMIREEHQRATVRRHLHGAQHDAFAGEFPAAGPGELRPVEPHAD